MIGVTFKVQRIVELHQHVGLAGAGHAAEHQQIALRHGLVEGLNQERTQRFIATGDARVINAGIVLEPLLHDLRPHAATKAIQAPVGMGPGKIGPCLQTLSLDLARDQLMPQDHGGLLALLLVARAHALTLVIGHQGQVDHSRKRPFVKLNRRTGVHHRPVIEEHLAQVGYVMSHHATSTAYVCRSTRRPIGSRCKPCSRAMSRNASLPCGVTATNNPPLVCGSHNTRLCSSWIGEILLA